MKPAKALILAAHLPRDDLTAVAGASAAHALRVANKPVVSFALDAAHAAGIEDVAVLVCKASRRHVRAALAGFTGTPPRWIETPEPLDYRSSLVAAADFLDASPFLVHSGDAILLQPLGPFVREIIAGAADALVLSRNSMTRDRSVIHLVKGIARRFGGDETVAGAHLFSPRALELAAAAETPDADGDLSAFVTALIQAGARAETRHVSCSWTYKGTIDHVLEANRMVLDELCGDAEAKDTHDGNRIEGRVSLHPTASLERTTIRGPAIIGPGVVLRDSFVGPYSSIGANVMIEGAEIEHSIVLQGATIRHPGQRLESSLVGEGATVARDFARRSSLRVRVGERTEVRLA